MTLILAAALTILLLAALAALLLGAAKRKAETAVSALEIHELLPAHSRHFPQVRQILSEEDGQFLAGRAPQNLLKQWRAERNRVLRCYLRGLAEDFRHLQKLTRIISALSPRLKRAQEWELLLLELKFQTLYRLTFLRLMARGLPLEQTARLTEIVSALGIEMQMALDAITKRVPEIGVSAPS